ncbi:MAG: hypothetical protein ACOYYS_20420 [Chloroflexota bacterium]
MKVNDKHTKLIRTLTTGTLCLLFLAATITPAAAEKHAPTDPEQQTGLSLRLTQWPAARVCLYGMETIGFALNRRNNAPVIGMQVSVSANIGQVTYSFNELTGFGNIAYDATSEGDVTVSIRAQRDTESTLAHIAFKVQPCGYTISIQGLAVDSNETARMYQHISGRGSFNRVGEYKTIEGSGQYAYEMALWGAPMVVQCRMEPNIKTSGSFQVMSAELPALVSGDFTVSVKLDPLTLPGTELKCTDTLSNYEIAPIPLPGGPADFNTYLNLNQMYFKSMGGEYTFNFGNGSGTVTVIPRINP